MIYKKTQSKKIKFFKTGFLLSLAFSFLFMTGLKVYAEPADNSAAAISAPVNAEIPFLVKINANESDILKKAPDGFTVSIEAVSNTAEADVETPLPDKISLRFYGSSSGSFKIPCFYPGDYVYRISQSTQSISGILTDTTVYETTVRVINSKNGGLEYEIWAHRSNDTGNKTDKIEFINHINPDSVQTGDKNNTCCWIILSAVFCIAGLFAAACIFKSKEDR